MPTIKKRGYAAKKKQQPGQEIVTAANKVSEIARANRKPLTIAGSVIAAVLIIAGLVSLMRSMQEEKAAPLLASAYEIYSPSKGTPPDYTKALELFRDVNKRYSSTRSGAMAQYYAGNCLMSLGRNDEALKEYQSFVSKYSGDKFLLGLVYERMGYLFNALGKQSDAIQAFEKSESMAGPGVSTVELAKLYEAAGNIPAAQNKYKLISDKLAGTKFAMDAMSKVQKISTPPASAPGTPFPAPAKGK